jgi:hypothetical protein
MSLSEVSSTLERERELLELLVFGLEEQQLLLAAGRDRWLTSTTREVEGVLAELARAELRRALAVDAVTAQLGLPAAISLRELAERVPAPWHEVLGEHRTAVLALTDEATGLAGTNRELLGAGLRAVRDALLAVDEQPPTEARGPVLVARAV